MPATTVGSFSRELVGLGPYDHLIFQSVDDYFKVNSVTAAGLTCVLYDACLTIDQEISTIWRSKLSWTKVLYILVRYYSILTLVINLAVNTNHKIPFSLCKHWFWFVGTNTITTTAIATAILAIRVNALYGWDRKVIAFTTFLWFVETGIGCVPLGLIVRTMHPFERPPNFPVPGCLTTPPSHMHTAAISWTTTVVVSCTFFLLTLRKFLILVKDLEMVPGARNPSFSGLFRFRKIAPTFHLFIRDGAFYFLLIFIVQLLNFIFVVIVFAGSNFRPITHIGVTWLVTVHAVLACRLVLNLRQAVNAGQNTQHQSLSWAGPRTNEGLSFSED